MGNQVSCRVLGRLPRRSLLRLNLKGEHRCELGMENQGALCVLECRGPGGGRQGRALCLSCPERVQEPTYGFKKGWEMISFEFRKDCLAVYVENDLEEPQEDVGAVGK